MSKDDLILSRLDEIQKLSVLSAKNVLTIEDVSLLSGLSVPYLYQLTSKKQIPFYKPNGKHIYFNKSEIEQWMLSNKVETVAESEQRAMSHCL